MPAFWLRTFRRRNAIARGPRQLTPMTRARLSLDSLEDRTVPAVASGNMVVSSFFESAIYEMSETTGAVVDTLVAPNSQSVLANPAGMAVGPDGNLYISSQSLLDPAANSIVEYNVGTGTLTTFIDSSVLNAIATANGDASFTPAGLSFGPDGNLYVSLNGGQGATSGGAVIRFDISNSGGVLSYSGTNTAVATGLIQPTEMTFGDTAATRNTLYVSNSGGEIVPGDIVAIAHADSASPSQSTFIASGTGSLNYPAGLTWGPQGGLYVVDLAATASHQGQILQFTAAGKFVKSFTSPSNALLFQFPSAIAISPSGDLLTANLGPTYPAEFGGPGTDGSIYEFLGNGRFSKVLSASLFPSEPVAFDGGTVDVTNFSPSVIVTNLGDVAPTVSAGNGYAIDEGSSLTLHAIGSDPEGYSLTYSWSINGTDTFGQATGANPTLTWAQLKALGVTAGSSLTVEVMASDGHGQVVTSAPVTVTVNQLPVKVAIAGPAKAGDDTDYNLALESNLLGGVPIANWTINWGDGTSTSVDGGKQTVQHVYTNAVDFYTISATATNEDSVTAAAKPIQVEVVFVPPKPTISGAASVAEGTPYTLDLATAADASAIQSWTINWGDGDSQTVTGNPSSVEHNFPIRPRSYAIFASVTTDGGVYPVAKLLNVKVTHAAPTLSISGPTSTVEDSTYILQLSGTEIDSDTIEHWTINWGDGSPLQVVSGNPTSVTHVFVAKPVNFTISATATDVGGTYAAADTVVLSVQHVPPTLSIIGASSINSGQTYTLFLSGMESVPDHSILNWTINWGDGATTVVKGNPASVTHVFTNSGTSGESFTISATATDDIGTYAAEDTQVVSVVGIPHT